MTAKRTRAVPAAVLTLGIFIAGCGGSGNTVSAKATSDAKAACQTLLALGKSLKSASASAGIQGGQIATGLQSAQKEADSAGSADAIKYALLASDVDSFTATIENGQSATQTQAIAVTNDCVPLLKK